ncbi:MAG: tetratricopeptide repeat protein [Arcobacteraceae bacterium]|nr:tetratricopeptide repeat protein [Arcobacteraceae bacterium]
MKKLLLTTTFLASLTFANQDATIAQNIIQKAMKSYQDKNYKVALDEFLKIKSFSDSAKIDYYIGRSYYELGNYEQALVAYERVAINEPNNKRVILETAQTYFMLEMYEEARSRFDIILADPTVPEIVKSNILTRLNSIDSKTKKHFTNFSILLGYGFDTNINNTTGIGSYSVYIPQLSTNLNLAPDKKKDSTFQEAGAILSHIYKYSESLAFRNGVTFYTQSYTEDNSKDLSLISLNTTPIYTVGKTNYMMTFGYDHIWYDDEAYLNNYYISPKISHLINDNLIYEGSVKVTKKDFFKPNSDKDSINYELSNKIMKQDNKYGIFGLEGILGTEKRDKTTRTDVSRDYATLRLSHTYKLSSQISINSNISYSDIKYKYTDVNFLSKRDDESYNLGVGFSYEYNKKTTLGLSYNYTNQNSNHEPFDYDKQVVKTSLYYNF